MKVLVNQDILNYENQPIVENGNNVTYRAVFAAALNTYAQDEQPEAKDKAEAFAISNKLFGSDEVELSVSEAALVIERVGKLYSPLVYGRAVALLNAKDEQ